MTEDGRQMTYPEASATGKRGGAEPYNPHLKAALLEVVKNQLRANLTAEHPDRVGAEL
ncbi:MAG: hypothetical protein MUO33_01905 [Sedimentisphaerales bacterium]|jgi:hypothetical protein|nr:hypothetical protein [Sedimentisphaerales bacterium]